MTLVVRSPISGEYPTLDSHLATRGTVADQLGRRVRSSTNRTASYTLTAADVGTEQVYSATSAGTFTLPTNATQAIAVGDTIVFRQSNTGQLTIAAAAGVTLQARGSAFKLAGQHAVAEARKVATDVWVLYGDITT